MSCNFAWPSDPPKLQKLCCWFCRNQFWLSSGIVFTDNFQISGRGLNLDSNLNSAAWANDLCALIFESEIPKNKCSLNSWSVQGGCKNWRQSSNKLQEVWTSASSCPGHSSKDPCRCMSLEIFSYMAIFFFVFSKLQMNLLSYIWIQILWSQNKIHIHELTYEIRDVLQGEVTYMN